MEEQRRLLQNQPEIQSSDEEDWSEEDSESYYSDSDSSVPEWETSISETTGELTYIDCHPFVVQNMTELKKITSEPFSRDQLRRSTRSKFLRLIRRRESKRQRKCKTATAVETTKVKFHDSQEGEEKEVVLAIKPMKQYKKLGNLAEIVLGINLETLSDGSRLMVAGFPCESPAKNEKNIKIGDWLKSIDNIQVGNQNIDSVLERLTLETVHLKLQRISGVEVTKDPPINELNNQSHFVHEFITNHNNHTHNSDINVLYLNPKMLTENSLGFEDVIYSFPKDLTQLLLYKSKGILITLNQLIGDLTRSKPNSTTIMHDDEVLNVTYTNYEEKLLFLMIPDRFASLKETILIRNDLLRMFAFMYETLDNCFCPKDNWQLLDNFFCRFFKRIANYNKWTSCNSTNIQISKLYQFESLLPAVQTLKLSHEAQMQIDDALTELEASDYRDWNEDPLDCQRLFTIIGSALYHFGYLVASHLMPEDLLDVTSYCRQQGLFHMSQNEPIKTLLLWKEVFPFSCSVIRNKGAIKAPVGRRYLLIVGSGKGLLAVIMEAGGCTEPPEPNMSPDAFYVEEAQATLAHLQELGLSELADRVLSTNPGVHVTLPETNRKRPETNDRRETHEDNRREPSGCDSLRKDAKITSILKNRNSEQIPTQNLDEEDSESDNEDESQISNGSFDTISELRQNLLSSGIDQRQLSAGNENVLFHFVSFDGTEGILINPPECSIKSKCSEVILDNFRRCCHRIRAVFQNTLRFKNLPMQDVAKSVINKSLIAVKEQGIMFECQFFDDCESKRHTMKYWVVGRLFYMPHPREVYVCYQDTIPQNVIELAFKIDSSTMS